MVESPKSSDRTPPKQRDLKANPEAQHLIPQTAVTKPFQGLQFSPELVAIALGGCGWLQNPHLTADQSLAGP